MPESFAPPIKRMGAEPRNTVAPAAGMGLTLDDKGRVPASALCEPWIIIPAAAMANSWVNYDTVRVARYCKDAAGFVHLAGIIKSGTIAAAFVTLPIGYRPDITTADVIFPVISNSVLGVATVSYLGVVTPAAGSNVYFCLDGINYRAAV